jgi:hypothetical protein
MPVYIFCMAWQQKYDMQEILLLITG